MDVIIKGLLVAMRSSEFWAAVAQAFIEATNQPVPEEVKAFGWIYIGLRVLGKVAKYVVPNPDNPAGGVFKND